MSVAAAAKLNNALPRGEHIASSIPAVLRTSTTSDLHTLLQYGTHYQNQILPVPASQRVFIVCGQPFKSCTMEGTDVHISLACCSNHPGAWTSLHGWRTVPLDFRWRTLSNSSYSSGSSLPLLSGTSYRLSSARCAIAELHRLILWNLAETIVASLLLKRESTFMPWHVWQ
jgi:hypothetical protein